MKVPNSPFERIQMDMIGPFPLSKNKNRYVLVAIDCLTRYGMAMECKNGNSKEVIKFLLSIINQYGLMKELQTDNGRNFVSKEIKEFAAEREIKLINSTPYHLQTNGMVERLNGILKTRIAIYTSNENEWDKDLQNHVFSYNNAIKKDLGKSPRT